MNQMTFLRLQGRDDQKVPPRSNANTEGIQTENIARKDTSCVRNPANAGDRPPMAAGGALLPRTVMSLTHPGHVAVSATADKLKPQSQPVPVDVVDVVRVNGRREGMPMRVSGGTATMTVPAFVSRPTTKVSAHPEPARPYGKNHCKGDSNDKKEPQRPQIAESLSPTRGFGFATGSAELDSEKSEMISRSALEEAILGLRDNDLDSMISSSITRDPRSDSNDAT
jgi:hypothetical protein